MTVGAAERIGDCTGRAVMDGGGQPAYAVALGSPVSQSTALSVVDFGGDYVTVKYTGLPGNRPKSYANTIYLWNASVIPWGEPWLASKTVDSDAESGTMTLDGLTISATTYVLGYAVGADPSLVCASAVLDAGGGTGPTDAVSVGARSIGTNSVTLRYSVLYGYLPRTNGNWLTIWKGNASPYNPPTALGSQPVGDDDTQGTVTIENVAIAIQTPYTVGYFMEPASRKGSKTAVAALLNFTTASLDGIETMRRV